VRRAKALIFSGCNSHRQGGAPAGCNRSGDVGDDNAGVTGWAVASAGWLGAAFGWRLLFGRRDSDRIPSFGGHEGGGNLHRCFRNYRGWDYLKYDTDCSKEPSRVPMICLPGSFLAHRPLHVSARLRIPRTNHPCEAQPPILYAGLYGVFRKAVSGFEQYLAQPDNG
jgi:hypothetical protein